jgi:ribonuclease BN (tRNA processing enzyme)
MERRAFLAGAAGRAGTVRLPAEGSGTEEKTRLILLGTGGGPRPRKASSAPAQVITHHHSDHNADYGNLIWLAWAAGLRTPVDTWGPPPLANMTKLSFQMNAYDIDTRIANEGRVPLVPLVHVHEVSQGGPVMQDERVKVTAAVVHHPPVVPALAYRFDAADRSIVARVPKAATLKQSIIAHQTSAEDAGRVAKAAGVKTLVLSHLVPAEDPEVTEQMWIDAARVHFRGPVIVGRDLLEI